MAGLWGKCRTAFRWCRLAAWVIALTAFLAALWLNRVGVPDFVKGRLVAALSQRGVKLEFSRMRLSLLRGFVADNVQIGNGGESSNTAFTAQQVQLRLNYPALLHGRWQLVGLNVQNGTFTLAASRRDRLSLTNVESAWRFEANDTWVVEHLQAGFAGSLITLSGQLNHATRIRDWRFFAGQQPSTNQVNLAGLLHQISTLRARFYLPGEPELNLFVDGDARDVHSVSLRAEATFPEVHSPWFSGRNLHLAARLSAPADVPATNDPAWGFWTNLQSFALEWAMGAADLRVHGLTLDTFRCGGDWHAPQLTVKECSAQIAAGKLDAGTKLDVGTRQLQFTNNSSFDPHLLAQWLTAGARAQLDQILWTAPPQLRVGGDLTLPPWTNFPSAWRERVAPTVRLVGELAFSNAVAGGRTLDYLQTHFTYASQYWSLTGLKLAQGRTQLAFDGEADEATHNFGGHLRGNLETASVRPFLTATNWARQLSRVSSYEPIALEVAAHGNWEDWPDLTLAGRLALTNFSVSTMPANRLDLDRFSVNFNYTNRACQFSSLGLDQGRTRVQGDGAVNPSTGQLMARLRGTFDLGTIQPFLTESQAIAGIGMVHLAEPLAFQVGGAGNWHDFGTLIATGRVALTNFSIRGQPADRVAGDFFYTNQLLEFFHPQLFRAGGTQMMEADKATLDFRHGRIYFTNGFGMIDPLYVVRCIGPKTTEAVEAYQFPETPTARVNGCAPMRDVQQMDPMDDADLTFVIRKPTPFRWHNLQSRGVSGTIHWHGQQLTLTNIVGETYGGQGQGNAHFYFHLDRPDTDFNFTMAVTNLNLHLLAVDLSSPTNTLEGLVTGQFSVTNGNSGTWRSWNGYGRAEMHNGLLWNIPIFGVASDALNMFSPGLGNSRATEASLKFGLTNGVIHSDLLEMHTRTMRLEYAGTVDLAQNVNARMTAQLLRNTPVVGSVVSTMLWPVSKIFECQVTGPLDHPKITPLWLPTTVSNVLLMPFHPLRSLEDMFSQP